MEDSTEPHIEQRWVTIPCGMCHNGCGIRVHVEKDKIVGVEGWPEHPYSRGRICVKARQIPEHVHHDARLKYPLKRENGTFQRISWDEALDIIARKLNEGKEKYGAASFGVFCGDPVELQGELGGGLAWRFCDVYGTPSRFHAADMCYLPLAMAQLVTLGDCYEPDLENSNCVIVWADNPVATYHVRHTMILSAKKRGAKLIIIDPKRIPLTKHADMHIRPRLGTDGIILLAMINTIISEHLYDREFVENWTVGFDKLMEHTRQHTPEEAERITGVAAEDIKKIARIYASNKPASIQCGFKLHQCQCGFHNIRSLAILSAITGNIQVPGGDLKWFRLPVRSIGLPKLMRGLEKPTVAKYPIYSALRFFNDCIVNWGDLVLDEPQQLRNVIIAGANPAVTWPNASKVRKALDKLDFLVVLDVLMTATAQMADIVLPACTFLEKLAPVTWRGWFLRRPVIEPQWESWPDSKFWLSLARHMGYEQYFPWKSDEEIVDYCYERSGLSVKKILELYPEGYIHPQAIPGERQYKQEGFRTRSGKVELYSDLLAEIGIDPLPTYLEPRESPPSTPELFGQFPLMLTTGTREDEYYHSEHRHLDRLRRRNPEPVAQIHPDTATKYGITDAEPMIIETKIGRLEIKAKVSDEVMPGMISVPHGWEEASENMLTDDTPVDPVSGYVALTGLLCRVRIKT